MTKKADPTVDEVRVPPHSISAEQSVLGGLLLDNGAWDRIGEEVSAADFYRHDHRMIFQEIVRLINSGKPADVITVFEQLAQLGKAEDCGGLSYLNAMAQNTPSAANIRRYAEIVRNRATARKLIATIGEIADEAYLMRDEDLDGLLDQAEAKVLAIAEERNKGKDFAVPLKPLLAEVVDRIDELYNDEDRSEITGAPTGLVDLDRLTSGLQPGDLIIVAGLRWEKQVWL